MTTCAIASADPVTDEAWFRLAGPAGVRSLFTSPPWIAAACAAPTGSHRGRLWRSTNGRTDWRVHLGDDRRPQRYPVLQPSVLRPGRPSGRRRDGLALAVRRCRARRGAPLHLALPGRLTRHRRRATASYWRSDVARDTAGRDARPAAPPDQQLRRGGRSPRRNARASGSRSDRMSTLSAVFTGSTSDCARTSMALLAQSVEFFERIWREFSPTARIITLLGHAWGRGHSGGDLSRVERHLVLQVRGLVRRASRAPAE